MVNTDARLAYSLDLSEEHFAGYAVLTLEGLSLLNLTIEPAKKHQSRRYAQGDTSELPSNKEPGTK